MAETQTLLNRIVKLPMRAFIISLEMFVQTAQELRRLIDQSIDAMLSAPDVSETASGNSYTNQVMPGGVTKTSDQTTNVTDKLTVSPGALIANGTPSDGAITTQKERVNMRDANLNDDMLKLVRYKILFVKRDYEMAFPEEEDLVSDNMTGADFSAWKVAEFIQKLGQRPPQVRFPKRWVDKTNYHRYALTENGDKIEAPPPRPPRTAEEGAKGKIAYEPPEPRKKPYWLVGFPEDDKKHLRVYYEVLERYPREKLRYEERQLEILEKIADRV